MVARGSSVKFLGLLGPQGALPLATTEEAYGWQLANNDAFPRFLDLLNHKFIQLFFRAWANSRPIAHRDLPERDRFKTYVGAMIGLGEAHFQSLDTVPDDGKLRLAGLMSPQTKSSSRLRRMICDLFGVKTEVDEFIGTRLALEDSERTTLGRRNSGLGTEILLGRHLLQRGRQVPHPHLRQRHGTISALSADRRSLRAVGRPCVFLHRRSTRLGCRARTSRRKRPSPTKLGSFGQLGWTTWMAPNWAIMRPIAAMRASIPRIECDKNAGKPRDTGPGGTKMADISLEAVTGKLNSIGYDAFIQALRHAKSAGNRNVELAHWLLPILQKDGTDLSLTADYFELDRSKLLQDVTKALGSFRKNETEMPGVSNTMIDLLDRGWHYATLFFGETQIRTGCILVGALKSMELRRAYANVSAEFNKISVTP